MNLKLEPASRDDPKALALFDAFIREADGPLDVDLDIEAEIAAGPPAELAGPNGVLLLVRVDGEPAGLGGVRFLDTEAAEIKTMFVSPAHRGQGVARAILAELERIAGEHGCRRTQLDTSDYLTGAVALYRAAGYREVPPYNDNPKANLWFERLLADDQIHLAPHNPDWPRLFEQERAALEVAIGRWAPGGIHHVGSTAVPGLDAKPIIDILVGVEDLETSRACFAPLADLGYLHAPYRSDEMHWFCKPHPSRRTHHLHLVPSGSRRFGDELTFRDRLRADPELAADYVALKHRLAARFANDREAYTEAKAEFIHNALGEG
jgi:GrpB-like predicted nucleotidyltransferase (UPF0157 family)/GNAT superfamily N-acetyltransferase